MPRRPGLGENKKYQRRKVEIATQALRRLGASGYGRELLGIADGGGMSYETAYRKIRDYGTRELTSTKPPSRTL